MKIMAIESSHDDTSICIYKNKKILFEKTISQANIHKDFGGTVPEIASRNHFKNFYSILKKELLNFDFDSLDYIAYTYKPGLIGSIHMGQIFAKTIGMIYNKKIIPINHMHGHIFSVCFTEKINFPCLGLIVSGGHSQIWNIKSYDENDIELIGETKDDAIGEVYDKIARKMNLGYPGGPLIDKLSLKKKEKIDFRVKEIENYNFSFSGLKTKVINYINTQIMKKQSYSKANVAWSFQNEAIKILLKKMNKAINHFKPNSILLGGGVAANFQLRKEFAKLHKNALIPSMKYTTDNAAMIAIRAHTIVKKEDF